MPVGAEAMGRCMWRISRRYRFAVIALLSFCTLAFQAGQARSATDSQNDLVQIVSRLTDIRQYPSQARAKHEEGIVFVRFAIDRSGHVLTPSLVRSSGYPLLDEEALAMLRRVGHLPPPPSSIPHDPVFLSLPVVFCLNSKKCLKS